MVRDDIPSTRELINNYIVLMEKSLDTQADQAKAIEKLKQTLESKLWWVIYILLFILAAQLGVDLGLLPVLGG